MEVGGIENVSFHIPAGSTAAPAGAIAVAYFAFRWLIRTGSLERR